MPMSNTSGPYVRAALPHEFPAASQVQARAFANDPLMNWLGSVQDRIDLPRRYSREQDMPKDMLLLYYFNNSLTLATHLVGGKVMVVVVPEGHEERIVSVALWIPPGKKVDGPLTIIRSQQYRGMFGNWKRPGGWGFTGFYRAAILFQPLIDKLHKKACQSRSHSFDDCWHLQEVTTDPEEEGKGFCSMLMRAGFEFIGSAPICLEATTPKSRELYLRYGFEITDSPLLGENKVGEDGLPPRNKEKNDTKATGFHVWTMIKFP